MLRCFKSTLIESRRDVWELLVGSSSVKLDKYTEEKPEIAHPTCKIIARSHSLVSQAGIFVTLTNVTFNILFGYRSAFIGLDA